MADTGSQPVKILTDDGKAYWAKEPRNPHGNESLLAEVICHEVAKYLQLPVPQYALVELPRNLKIHSYESPDDLTCFGSELITGTVESRDLKHLSDDDNSVHAPRFIALWEWCDGNDEQFLYQTLSEHSLVSFDFGMWLGIEAQWSVSSYTSKPPPHSRWPGSVKGMSTRSFIDAANLVGNLTQKQALQIVSAVPVEWGFTDRDLIEVARFLMDRATRVKASLQAHSANAKQP
ncbi:HipA family kinase [Auritidibacter ignavus]|uniref:HipA family kinase n=1 Tax=Auritidibacter ignavus TaxID=678932 RepID=UPI00109C437D|nr:HipA family kinase [Auritidibacter ignavus]